DLQNLMMNIRMIPLNHIFNRFPRTVRDIAHRQGKEVEFVIEGGDTELDRSVMDGLNDPLLHLIRNGIDHGIESPAVREAAGKPAKGTLLLSARRDRDNVIITIEDDGGGIDVERVRKKAVERGLVSAETAGTLSHEDVIDFLFRPGFSTAEAVTDISGRGVGLDVVRTTLESLKGSIKVESTLGKGSRFELLLPPTMAIVTVMMVRINGRRCAIPVQNVVEVASLVQERIHSIGGHEAILLRDEVLPLDRLDDMFGNSEKSEILVVLQHQSRKRTICADLIEGQQEVVIKPLSNVVGICRGISGVTIPGDGEVVPVLDVNSMIKEN
ncbi:MAG: chemotaxis protein CheA, partial [Methanolinea sp.]|nr:chemotaxis protein CheA [Methanolinea sp.]